MNSSKTSGSTAGPHTVTPAKAAPAGSSGIPAKPAKVPSGPAGVHAPRPTGAAARPSGGASPRPGSATPGAGRESSKARSAQPHAHTGKVVHDERGNAVWDWLKQTGRNAIESTTRMLRKLESPELKVEEAHEEELRIQPDSGSSPGGGYDPYNQPIKSRRTPIK
jgi:hypothetical protein